MEKESKIYVAGHRGMVGSAIVRKLTSLGYTNLLTRTSSELDLRNQQNVADFFEVEKPEYVFLAAAKVGGIVANNTYRADFLYENLAIQNNIIHGSYVNKVKKLMFLGSSCIYPKLAPQPLKESYLLSGYLEPTNEPYAIAKIAGIKLCQAYAKQYGKNFISAMPTNLYGPNDNFDLRTSHVLPALIRKVHEAKTSGARTVAVWGTGTPRREFLHVDDLADACLFLLNNYDSPEIVNIGCGEDFTIRELVETVCETLGFDGDLIFDTSKPDGTPRKLLNIEKIRSLGWSPRIPLREGILDAYTWFLKSAR